MPSAVSQFFHTTASLNIGYSPTTSLNGVQQHFPNAVLHSSLLLPNFKELLPKTQLSLDAVELFIERDPSPGLQLARELIFRSNERDLNYFVYELLRAVGRLNQDSLVLATQPEAAKAAQEVESADQPTDQLEQAAVSTAPSDPEFQPAIERSKTMPTPAAAGKLQQVTCRTHGRPVSVPELSLFSFAWCTGRVGFVRVDKVPRKGGQHMVQLLIEVRDGDVTAVSTQESLVAQTVVQLLAAATQNDEDTWAALINFHFWRFFQVLQYLTCACSVVTA